MNYREPRGRRAGKPDTRGQILQAARHQFLAGGYRAVTMRTVAAAAGVDAALVSYYFGSKRRLFTAAVTASANPAETIGRAVDGDLDGLPERVLRDLVTLWDDPVTGAPLVTMLGSIQDDSEVADLFREMLEHELLARIAARLRGPDATVRAAAFCTQVAGIVVTRYVLRLRVVAAMAPDELVRTFAPALRATLLPPRRPRAAALHAATALDGLRARTMPT